MKVIIFEDEIPAYEKLLGYINTNIPEVKILGWGRSIVEAEMLLEKNPEVELIFSDIELLDGNSFSVFGKSKVNCPIIFSTAFDQYLFQAFQSNGIAYLLKPYTESNFKEALGKYHTLFENGKAATIDQNVITELKAIIEGEKTSYKRRFSIKKKSGIKILNIEDIVSFEANGDFCVAYDSAMNKHIINYNLGNIESKIDPKQFFRINRSEIINIDYVDNIEPHFKNRLAIKLAKRPEAVYTSSTKTPSFRTWLDS